MCLLEMVSREHITKDESKSSYFEKVLRER